MYKEWFILILVHTGSSAVRMSSGFGEVSTAIIGVEDITQENKRLVRARIERHFKVDSHDVVVLMKKQPDGNWDISDGLDIAFQKPDFSMGTVPMRIF